MNKNQLLPLAYITVVSAISLYLEFSYLFVFGLFPLVLLRREWLIPMLFMPSLVGGALDTPDLVLSIGILTVILLTPVLLWDSIKSREKIPSVYTLFFMLFILLVVLGLVVYGVRFGFDTQIFVETLITLSKLGFVLLLLKFLITKGEVYIYYSLQNTLSATIPVILLVIGYSLIVGERYGIVEYLIFGGEKHGVFTAILTSFSIYILYWFYYKDSISIRKLISPLILVLIFYTILQMGSKNGLLSFTVMIFFGLFFFSNTRTLSKKIIAVGFAIFIIGIGAIYYSDAIIDSPTIERFTNQVQRGGIERVSAGRTEIWRAGLIAFIDAPIIGWGGGNQAVISTIFKYGGYDNVTHNTILSILVRYGMVGLTLYVAFVFTLYKRGKLIYNTCRKNGKYLLFIPVFFFFMMLLSSMFVSWLWEILIWYNAVLVISISTIIKRNN